MRVCRNHRDRGAFATAAVIILLFAASALMLTTAGTFRILHRELRFTEQQHQERWDNLPPVPVQQPSATNRPAAVPAAVDHDAQP